MSDSSPAGNSPAGSEQGTGATVIDRGLTADFRDWYRERRARKRAREGKFEYIGPRDPPPTDVHFPSSLLACQRKRHYREANAPAEEPEPLGHFRIGNEVETALVVPFLEDRVAGPDQAVTNGLGFEEPIETESGTVRLRGKTDPVVTTGDGDPLLVTEVKTISDLDRLDGPREHHRAQVHAYLAALAERLAGSSREALLLYISKATLELRAYRVAFDEAFWTDRVLSWMEARTAARESDSLPAAVAERDGECRYCEFRRRCGQTDYPAANEGPIGFLPRHEYPKGAVREHLEAHGAILTPTLAAAYPTLAKGREVADWACPVCGQNVAYGALDWSGDPVDRPPCPRCSLDGDYVPLKTSLSHRS